MYVRREGGSVAILFKPDMVDAILAGRKTVTRRRGAKRWNVGAVHQAKTSLFGEPFARLRIRGVLHERFPGQTQRDIATLYRNPPGRSLDMEAYREAFSSWLDFCAAYVAINGGDPQVLYEPCWRIEFEVVNTDA